MFLNFLLRTVSIAVQRLSYNRSVHPRERPLVCWTDLSRNSQLVTEEQLFRKDKHTLFYGVS